jgi:FtsP/CotA-like multicopper oxidase with cupredoxin domain
MMKRKSGFLSLLVTAVVLAASIDPCSAAEFYLRAGTNQLTMPDNTAVTIWGFALDTDNNFGTVDGAVTSPGPMLSVPANDTTLTIHLLNTLPEPVSIVIPGQIATMDPQFFTDAQGRRRVRAFTAEAAANGGEATYTWSNFRAGTFLYQSGSHPAVQVQMGLFGGIRKDTADGLAYTGVEYTREAILFLSEIDPALHAAVAGGTYGPGRAMTSTVDYAPKYFLWNGQAEITQTGIVQAITAGDTVLVRLVNAGLLTRSPELLGSSMAVLAEDGNRAPYFIQRNTLSLLAGKTMDVMVSPQTGGATIALFDRRGYTSVGTDDSEPDTPTGQVIAGLAVPPPTGTVVQGGGGGAGGGSDGGGGGGGCFINSLMD